MLDQGRIGAKCGREAIRIVQEDGRDSGIVEHGASLQQQPQAIPC